MQLNGPMLYISLRWMDSQQGKAGGGRGIRTPGTVSRTAVFKSIGHFACLAWSATYRVAGVSKA